MKLLNKEIEITKDDILANIYFIAEMAQTSHQKGMYGALAGKNDLMGGILDRWINVVPERIIFEKLILMPVIKDKPVKVISDFYKYTPKQETTGIAPDVLGLKINDTIIPFCVFDKKWTPVTNMPQIEVKTFKSSQQMVSLRDQGYQGEYLILVEANYKVDYLIPFFDAKYFSLDVYKSLVMNDEVFIKSDPNNLIAKLNPINLFNESLGTLKLLCITKTEAFEKCSICCKGGITPLSFKNIIEVSKVSSNINLKLDHYCSKIECGLYKFDDNWYKDYLDKHLIVNFYCDKIDSILVIRRTKSSMYIKVLLDCKFNNTLLVANKLYKIEYGEGFDRTATKNKEYFFQKELVNFIPSYEEELLNKFDEIINK